MPDSSEKMRHKNSAGLRRNKGGGLVSGVVQLEVESLQIGSKGGNHVGHATYHLCANVVKSSSDESALASLGSFAGDCESNKTQIRQSKAVHSNPATLSDNTTPLFEVISVPFCVPEPVQRRGKGSNRHRDHKARIAFGSIQLQVFKRDLSCGEDELAGCAVFDLNETFGGDNANVALDGQVRKVNCTLRGARGRGTRGSIVVAIRFVASSQNPCGCEMMKPTKTASIIRLFLSDLRCEKAERAFVQVQIEDEEPICSSIYEFGISLAPGICPGLWNDCLEFLRPEGFTGEEMVNIKLVDEADSHELGSTSMPISALSSTGKQWLQLGESSCVRIVGNVVPAGSSAGALLYLPAASPPGEKASSLIVRLGGVAEVALDDESVPKGQKQRKLYVIAQLFPLVDGENRGRQKLRDVARSTTVLTSESSENAARADWDNETLEIPWSGSLMKMARDTGVTPKIHLSIWDEQSGSADPTGGSKLIAESCENLAGLVEACRVAVKSGQDFISLWCGRPETSPCLKVGLSFSAEKTSRRANLPASSPGDSFQVPVAITIHRLRNVPNGLKNARIVTQVTGKYGESGEVEQSTEEVVSAQGDDVVWDKLLVLNDAFVASSTNEGFLRIALISNAQPEPFASAKLSFGKAPEQGGKKWLQLALAHPASSSAEGPRLLVSLHYEKDDVHEAADYGGIRTNFLGGGLGRGYGTGSKIELKGAPPGVIILRIAQLLVDKGDWTDCRSASIQMSCLGRKWTASLEPTLARTAGVFEWKDDQEFKFPFQWSLGEKQVPALSLVAKGKLPSGESITVELGRADLAPLVQRPSKPVSIWLHTDGAKALVRVVFAAQSQGPEKFALAPRQTQQAIGGKIHVHLKSGSKFTNRTGPLKVHLSVLSQDNATTPASAISRLDEDGDANPVWNEHFVLPCPSGSKKAERFSNPLLSVQVVGPSGVVASAIAPIFDDVMLEGHLFEAVLPLAANDTLTKAGEIRLGLQVILDDYPDFSNSAGDECLAPQESRVGLQILGSSGINYAGYNWLGQIEPVLRLVTNSGQILSSAPASKIDPQWLEMFAVAVKQDELQLVAEIINDNALGENALIATGQARIQLGTGHTEDQINVHLKNDAGSNAGTIHLAVHSECPETDEHISGHYYKIKLVAGSKLRAAYGRVHRAIAKVELISSDGKEVIKVLAQSRVESDTLRRRIAPGDADNGETKAMFQWDTEFNVQEADTVTSEGRPGHLILRLYDATHLDALKLIGSLSLATCAEPEWSELEPSSTDAPKGAGAVLVGFSRVPHARGAIKVAVDGISGEIPMRSVIVLDKAETPEFIKLRVEPDGCTVRSGPNMLSQELQTAFCTYSKGGLVRDKISVNLLVNDPSLAENILGSAQIDLVPLLTKAKSQTIVAPLMHPVTQRPLGPGISMSLNVSVETAFISQPQESARSICSTSAPIATTESDVEQCIATTRLKSLFYRIDADHSGTVDTEELTHALGKDDELLKVLTGRVGARGPKDARQLFDEMDTDGDKTLSWGEFRAFCTRKTRQLQHNVFDASILDGGDESMPAAEKEEIEQCSSKGDSNAAPRVPPVSAPGRKRRSSTSTRYTKGSKSSRSSKRSAQSQALKMRDTSTEQKYDENAQARRRLADPIELQTQIQKMRAEQQKLAEENRLLKSKVAKTESQARLKLRRAQALAASSAPFLDLIGEEEGPGTEYENVNDGPAEPLFDQGGGDESMAPPEEADSESTSESEMQIKLREMEHALKIKDDLHRKELEAARGEKLRLQDELDDALEGKEAAENLRNSQSEQLRAEKTKRSKLQTSMAELDSELSTFKKIGKDGLSEASRKLLWLSAQHAERDAELQALYAKSSAEAKAAARLQALIRGSRQRKAAKVQQQARLSATLSLQAAARAMIARKRFVARKGALSKASRAIQASFRGKRARDQLGEQHKAATAIQSSFRATKDRARAADLAALKRSAVTIQNALRSRASRKLLAARRDSRNKEERAALLVQGVVRRAFARQRVALVREEREQQQVEFNAATAIQNVARRRKAAKQMDEARVQRADCERAAITIQRKLRSRKEKSDQVDHHEETDKEEGFQGQNQGDESMPEGDETMPEASQDEAETAISEMSFDKAVAFLKSYADKRGALTKEKAKQRLSTAAIDIEQKQGQLDDLDALMKNPQGSLVDAIKLLLAAKTSRQ